MKYNVHIKGIRPLLYAKPPIGVDLKKPGTKVTVEQQAKDSLYSNEKGTFAPSLWFECAMMAVASEFLLKGKKTFKDLVKASVFVTPLEIPLISSDKEYTIFSRLVKKGNGERVMLANALYEDWEFEFTITTTDERLDFNDQVIEILKAAGGNKAVGGWRPRYGRFEVLSFERIK